MKMRKILSFVLVLSLVLGSFSMAFAATPATTGLSDIDASANKEAIQVSYDLGIVTGNPDGTYLPAKAVNRAEFAAMITRALGVPASALAGYSTTNFKDTNGYAWAVPYLAFCQSKGIMLGDGAGNVMPGRTINTNEAVTMALRAVGYTANSSELIGMWPSNYVTKAQDLGLYSDVAAVVSVDKGNAAQIIYNTLPIRKVAVNTDGRTDYVSDVKVDGVSMQASMLTTGLNCTYSEELISYNDSALINVTPYVGAWATVYKNSDKDVIAISPISEFVTGEFDGAGTFTIDSVDYTVKPVSTTTIAGAYVNAKLTSSTSTIGNAVTSAGSVTLAVDKSGKTINKIYSIAEWTTTNMDQADKNVASEIKDKKLFGKEFYKNDEKEIDLKSFALDGVASLDKIAEDNVVYVYTYGNLNAEKIVKVEVGTAVVEGTVSSYKLDDGYGVFTIAGKSYTNVSLPASDDAVKDTNVGDDVKVWLDVNGDAYTYEVTKGQTDKYAVVTGTQTSVGYDDVIKLMTSDATDKQYSIDMDTVPALTKGLLAGYSIDKDGKIDGLTAIASSNAILAGSNSYMANNSTITITSAALGAVNKSYVVSSDVVVYTYEGATPATATDFDVSSVDKIEKGTAKYFSTSDSAVFMDKNGKVVAMLVPADKAESGSDSLYAVINDQLLTVDSANDKVYKLTGFAGGTAFDKLTTGTTATKSADVDFGTKVQLYKMATDASKNITKLELVPGFGANGAPNVLTSGNSFAATSGLVVDSAGTGYIKAATTSAVVAIASNAVVYEVEYDGANIDAYSIFSGTIREGYSVWVFETDDDFDGYDVVVVKR